MEKMHRQELTAEAMKKLEKKKDKSMREKGLAEGLMNDEHLSPMTHSNLKEEEGTEENPAIKISPAVPRKPVPSLELQQPGHVV